MGIVNLASSQIDIHSRPFLSGGGIYEFEPIGEGKRAAPNFRVAFFSTICGQTCSKLHSLNVVQARMLLLG
jgi:hypothetical protein